MSLRAWTLRADYEAVRAAASNRSRLSGRAH